MSLLTLIQSVTPRIGLPKPTAVISNTDEQIIQLLEIAQEEGEELASRFPWSKMVFQNTFTVAASQDQGLFNSTIVTAGDYDYMIPETFWNQTTTVPFQGPLSVQEWETRLALGVTGPFPAWLERAGRMYLNPTPTLGTETGAFEYKSTFWCESSGLTGQAKWAADSDIGRLDERIMSLGVIWRWKEQKGLSYGENFTKYEKRVLDAYARDGGRPILNSGGRRVTGPNISAPIGTWNL